MDVVRVRTGVVLLSALDSNGQETLCCLRGSGSCLNLSSLQGRPSAYRAEALTPVEVCYLGCDVLRSALLQGGATAEALLELLLEDSWRWLQGRRRTAGRRASARFAGLILEMHSLGAHPNSVPRSLLARLLRVRPETVSRVVQELREAGALDADLALLDRDHILRMSHGQ